MWFGMGKQKQEAIVQQPVPVQWRHPSAHPQGGFNLSKDDDSNTQAVTASIFKQVGAKLVTGKFGSLAEFSKPIAMSVEISFLHQLANGEIYCSLLEKAGNLTNVEQIKYICAYLIGGLSVNGPIVKLKSPLDPLLGETLQLIKEDGTQFYAEQTSFDPPICNFQIIGNNYTIKGVDRMDIQVHKTVNSLTGRQLGWSEVKFANGNTYRINQPVMEITGLVYGDRIMNFSGQAIIEGQGLKAVINFNYNSEGIMKKLTSFFASSEQAKIHDVIEIDIIQKKDDKEEVILEGIGSWLEDLKFEGDDDFIWKVDQAYIKWNSQEQQLILDSDSTRRADRSYMLQNKMEDAQQAKYRIEEQNKTDGLLRKQQRQ